jgi:hypothetical protein
LRASGSARSGRKPRQAERLHQERSASETAAREAIARAAKAEGEIAALRAELAAEHRGGCARGNSSHTQAAPGASGGRPRITVVRNRLFDHG